jgi:hypothetical protein
MAALAVGGHLLGTIAGIAGARTQAAAAKFQGQVQAANFKAEAQAYKFNAKVAEQQARNTREVALAHAKDFRRAGSGALSSRRASMAASGVSTSSGSPLLIDEAIATEIEFGAQRILNEGEIVATRQKNEATLLKAQAKNAKRNARFAIQGGQIAASAANIGIYSAIASGATGIGNTLMSAGTFG